MFCVRPKTFVWQPIACVHTYPPHSTFGRMRSDAKPAHRGSNWALPVRIDTKTFIARRLISRETDVQSWAEDGSGREGDACSRAFGCGVRASIRRGDEYCRPIPSG